MADAVTVALVGAASGGFVALVSIVKDWLARRKSPRLVKAEERKWDGDAAAAVAAAFEKLVTDLQEERQRLISDLQEERRAYKHEIANLRTVIKALQHYSGRLAQHAEALEGVLRQHGITVPMLRPTLPDDVAGHGPI
jgi:7-keto-8-aminopelargonate synthetase-like enzyme